ncbi:retrotransposon gag protein [Cucumis melo var. makuwa]|uniref:Retrotransposon gag protein n=1 Tax=Cucumis melo var. makuwa TaxID=1194695 RepID=A0A5D3BZT3_CUCMM|nr:retrotransposon gag protein [Cucumis melo var. makuwa]TYK04640.1 retrotransposon gag protein [Cucumis melo var. makuwa]
MTSTKATSKSSVASDAYIGPITRSHSKGIIQRKSLCDNSDSASSKLKKEVHPDVMSVMIADITAEAAMVEMKRKINLLMKFVRSLEGNAFEWYNLEPEVIDRWEQLEKEFLNHFYGTRRTPRTFEELATRAHDMEFSIASRGTKDFPVPEVRKDKKETKGDEKIVKSTMKKSMVLLKCRRPVQGGKVNDPNYCKYHRIISHPVKKCFMLKELIIRLAREKKIELDLEEVAQTNHVAVTIMSKALLPILIFEQRKSLVQFGTFEPIVDQFYQEVAPKDSQEKERSIKEDDEEWIVLTH